MAQRSISDRIFDWPSDEIRLKASRCVNCGNHMFPPQQGCPKCSSVETEPVELKPSGTLWSWTIQGFPPKRPYIGEKDPEKFVPYGVGYIDLEGQLKVEGRLTINDPDQMKIGMPMTVVPEVIATDEDGTEVVTFAFAPEEQS